MPEAKEKMRVDNLKTNDKYDYDAYIKEQRIKESEIKTAIFDAKIEVEDKLLPIIEQERQKAEQERKKLITTIKNMKAAGMSNEAISKFTGEIWNLSKKYLSE